MTKTNYSKHFFSIILVFSLFVVSTALIPSSSADRDHSANVNLIGRALYGQSWDVFVVDNIAYACVGSSYLIIDISNTDSPAVLGIYDSFERFPLCSFVSGDYAYVDGGQSLYILDIHDKGEPKRVGEFATESGVSGIHVIGDYAFIGNGPSGLRILDVSNKEDPHEVGYYDFDDEIVTSIYVVNDYVYLGYDDNGGFRIIDVHVKEDPTEISIFDAGFYIYDLFILADYAYVVSENGFDIIDISDKEQPVRKARVETGDPIQIHVIGDYAYVGDFYDGLHIYDVREKSNPVEVGYYDSSNHYDMGGCAEGVFVVGDNVFIANGIHGGIHIVNVRNKVNPELVGLYEGSDHAQSVFVSGEFCYITDRRHGMIILDVRDKLRPIQVGSFDGCIVRDIHVQGEFAFVLAYDDGLHILDISDKTNPIEVGRYITDGSMYGGIYVEGNYAYIAEYGHGLRIIDIRIKENPVEVGSYPNRYAYEIFVHEDYAYLAAMRDGLIILDIRIKQAPIEVSNYLIPTGRVRDVFVVANNAYVAYGEQGLHILNVTNKFIPVFMGSVMTSDEARSVSVSANYAFLGSMGGGVRVIDISNINNPSEVGFYDTSDYALDAFAEDNTVYVADNRDGFYLLELDYVPPLEKEESSEDNNYLFIVLAGTTAFLLLFAAYLSEPFRIKLYSILFIPLYTRIREDSIEKDVRQQNIRGRIFQFINDNPSTNFSNIKRNIPAGHGTTIYHLSRLEREGYIRSVVQGKYKMFWPKRDFPEMEDALLTAIQRRIMNILDMYGTMSRRELAKETDLPVSTLHYNVKKLVNMGKISEEKNGTGHSCTIIQHA